MGIKAKITLAIFSRVGISRAEKMKKKQLTLNKVPGMLISSAKSPARFEIPQEMIRLLKEGENIKVHHSFPIRTMLSMMKNINLSVDSISKNPKGPAMSASSEFVDELKKFIHSTNVDILEFVKLSPDLIFQGAGVIYDNAIILAMEMSEDKINKAPSQETIEMVFDTYDALGIAANQIAAFLRERGYAAQADHPLGGLALFPPLAQKAGIGWVGRLGILITPKFGPRVRLAAVYTSIQDLPFVDSNEHSWIDDYCNECGLCIEQCPAHAILDKIVVHESGQITRVNQKLCFEYFAQYYGCSVCIKVCPFSQGTDAYEHLKPK
ncbi:MAG: reductive dehalogenase domain-containing protein [Candidatus Thorarchaeota archaeon]